MKDHTSVQEPLQARAGAHQCPVCGHPWLVVGEAQVESLRARAREVRSNRYRGGPAVGETGYRGSQACKIVGVTYRQLDYWTNTGLIQPSVRAAQGTGSRRLYSFNDLLRLKAIKDLADAGVSFRRVREVLDYQRDVDGAP